MTDAIMSIPHMYGEVYRLNTDGIEGYDFEKKYEDPTKMIKERQSQSMRQHTRPKVPPKGSYLDEVEKESKVKPSPGQYNYPDEWPKKSKSLRTEPKKKTYLDEIITRSKKEKFPAPGQYNCVKTLKQIEAQNQKLRQKKPADRDKINYLDQVAVISNATPGPGMYNAANFGKSKIKQNRLKPQDWRKKAQTDAKKKPIKNPDMGTYNPKPTDFVTFDNLTKTKSAKHSDWNKQIRFDIPVPGAKGKKQQSKTKSKSSNIPGPGHYQMIHKWNGKEEKVNKRQKDYFDAMAKPQSKSVYYH